MKIRRIQARAYGRFQNTALPAIPRAPLRGVIVFLIVFTLLAGLCLSGAAAETVQQARDRIVVISDLHLGVDDAFSENCANKAALAAFLTGLEASQDVAELVIDGDLMDEWFLPAGYVMPASLSDFHDEIVKNNQAIFDAINRLIAEGNIKVTYVPGNHDMLFTREEAERILPGIRQARDAEGLGTYRNGGVVIEHGHRYSFTCAPDPLSNAAVTGGGSLLPSGYFFTRLAATSITEGMPASANALPEATAEGLNGLQTAYYKYYMGWKGLLGALPIHESFSDPLILTGIDGYADPYSVLDFVPVQGADGAFASPLYGDVVENWEKREEANLVPVPLTAEEAIIGASTATFTDSQAQKQYFDEDASVRVVVFGHSHIAGLTPMKNLKGADVLCANSGSWIDHPTGSPSRTYVVISPSADGERTTVSLYQYSEDGTSSLLNEASVDN